MERAQIEASIVQCDEKGCDWTQNTPWDEVQGWHKKTCPRCGNGEIIRDEDLAAWHGLTFLLLLDKAIDPDGKLPRVDITLDTSGLRI